MAKFMLLTKHGAVDDVGPMTDWSPGDISAHLDFLAAVNKELVARGELVEMAGDTQAAVAHYRLAASRTTNTKEQHYLTIQAARLRT